MIMYQELEKLNSLSEKLGRMKEREYVKNKLNIVSQILCESECVSTEYYKGNKNMLKIIREVIDMD